MALWASLWWPVLVGLCLQPGLGIAFALGEADFEVAVAAAQLVEEIFFACLWQHCHIVGELEEAAHVAWYLAASKGPSAS